MASHPPLSDWLDFLGEFMPPAGHLVVGAGSGTSEIVRYLIRKQAGLVALVEADGTAFKQLPTDPLPHGIHGYKQTDQLSHHDYLFAMELRLASGVSGSMEGEPDGF